MQKHYNHKAGYTLVELAISISIIALLISVILVGSSLVASTESKAMLSEVQKFNESVSQFQSLYKSLPGDLPNASSYWPSAAFGNGDGQIASEPSNEPFYAIQHLSLAGLLDGSYLGFTGTWGGGFAIATSERTGNVIGIKGRIGTGIYMKCCSGTDYLLSSSNFNNHVMLFAVYGADSTKRSGALTPVEAYLLDKKVDDGVPDTGIVSGEGSYSGTTYAATGCYNNAGSASTYNVNIAPYKDAKGCQMMFAYDWN
jgi:hypothetical protein